MRFFVLFFIAIFFSGNDCLSQTYISPLDSLFTNNIKILGEKCRNGKSYDPFVDKNDQLVDFLDFMNTISDTLFTFFPDGMRYTYPHFNTHKIDTEHLQLLNHWYQSHKYAINACVSIEDYEDQGKYEYPNFPLTFEELEEFEFNNSKVDLIKQCILEYKQNVSGVRNN